MVAELLQRDVPLHQLNSFGLPARAAWFAVIETLDQLAALMATPEWRYLQQMCIRDSPSPEHERFTARPRGGFFYGRGPSALVALSSIALFFQPRHSESPHESASAPVCQRQLLGNVS